MIDTRPGAAARNGRIFATWQPIALICINRARRRAGGEPRVFA
jgi:hypothetical protein